MFKVAVLDDDHRVVQELCSHIHRYQQENKVAISVAAFTKSLELISDYEPIYDVLLLDIEMPHLNGMEVAKIIRKMDPYVVIVFITNTAKYAINGYEVSAYDYMMKPVEYTHFSIKFSSILEASKKANDLSLLVPVEDGSRHIRTSEILYIEVRDHWLNIVTKEGIFGILGSLKEMEEKLSAHDFVRCNKSYLINLQYVTRLKSDVVIINNNYQLEVARSRRKALQEAVVNYYHHVSW